MPSPFPMPAAPLPRTQIRYQTRDQLLASIVRQLFHGHGARTVLAEWRQQFQTFLSPDWSPVASFPAAWSTVPMTDEEREFFQFQHATDMRAFGRRMNMEGCSFAQLTIIRLRLMMLTVLLGDHLSPIMQSTLLWVSFFVPHLNNVSCTPHPRPHARASAISKLPKPSPPSA